MNGSCKCKAGWGGKNKDCKEFKCKNNCSKRGICNAAKEKCDCYDGFLGDDCSKKPCPNSCKGAGKCDHNTGKCKCNVGVIGADCSKRKCPTGCKEPHGKCDDLTAVCLCNEGWEGGDCQKKVLPCARKCPANGACNEATKRCECKEGWTGRDCNMKQCPNACSGHGACNEVSGTCTCHKGFGGKACMAVAASAAWGYQGANVPPSDWSSVSPHFRSCADGRFQSPIRVPWDGKQGGINAFFHNITFGYKTIKSFNTVGENRFYTALMHMNDPHYFYAGAHRYQLRNVTIHTPAEHSFGNKHYDMEVQLNHEDDYGNLANVAILFEAKDEVQGNFYQRFSRGDFWRGATRESGRGSYMSLGNYLPKNKEELHFYTYQGSQTHPPCYEGVQWFVMSKAHQVLRADVEHLLRKWGSNARPIQPQGKRYIQFY